MFNWFWEFLYGLVKALFQLADALIYGSKKLCGIDSIEVNGEETDILSYLFRSNEVNSTFKVAALSGVLVVMFFAVFAIIRSLTSRKQDTTPMGVLVQTGKTLLMFLFVPAVMMAFMWICNEFVLVLNTTMTGSSESTLGSFLFTTCAEDAWYGDPSTDFIEGIANYADVGQVTSYISLKNFNYLLAFLAGIAILFPIATMLIMFVDRAISIVLLFIVSPYSISSNVLDDGAHFKLWRDQVLIKFVTGYGCVIALNIYAIVIKLVISNGVVFFPTTGAQFLPVVSNSFLNSLMKVAIIVGGAFSLQKIMAVVGNLVASGAGSNELRDTAMTGSAFSRFLGGAARGVVSTVKAPFSLARSAHNVNKDVQHFGLSDATSRALGYRTERDYQRFGWQNQEEKSANKYSEQPNYSATENSAGGSNIENIINNGGSSENNIAPKNKNSDAVTSAIMSGSGNMSNLIGNKHGSGDNSGAEGGNE